MSFDDDRAAARQVGGHNSSVSGCVSGLLGLLATPALLLVVSC
jgi:hypothetical protein